MEFCAAIKERARSANFGNSPGPFVSTKSSSFLSEFVVVTDLLVDGPPKPIQPGE
jgi:hypothetical protein